MPWVARTVKPMVVHDLNERRIVHLIKDIHSGDGDVLCKLLEMKEDFFHQVKPAVHER